jgi:NTE family protein
MTIRLNLALQGGGAHGAFTWGVLDRLLDDEGLEIAAMSGTSAGAMNAAACKAGLLAGGRKGAQKALATLWAQVEQVGDFRLNPWVRSGLPYASAATQIMEDMLSFSPMGVMAQLVSPYATAFQKHPLADIVAAFDFRQVCADDGPQIFVAATNVTTGRVRVFDRRDLTPDAILASACLPTVFPAVMIDGEPFWDGGFVANPPLWPLYAPDLPDDIVIVQINPAQRPDLPMAPVDIQNRINEISFNASLMGELRAAAFVKRLIAGGQMPRGQMKDVLFHLIADNRLMADLSATTKLLPTRSLLKRLHRAGRRAADAFLDAHRGKIGHAASIDVTALYA